MKKLLLAAMAVAATVGVTTAAEAREGCGPGFHRTPRGVCISNRAGRYYAGQGWWNGRRYYQRRYRYRNNWRYR